MPSMVNPLGQQSCFSSPIGQPNTLNQPLGQQSGFNPPIGQLQPHYSKQTLEQNGPPIGPPQTLNQPLGQQSGFNPSLEPQNTLNQHFRQQSGFDTPMGQSNYLNKPLGQAQNFNEPLNQQIQPNIYNPAQINNFHQPKNLGQLSNTNQQPTFQPLQSYSNNFSNVIPPSPSFNVSSSIYNQRAPSGKKKK